MPSRLSLSSRERLIAEARTWLGTPFHHQARKKGVGVDCVGLIVKAATAAGFPLRDHAERNYSRYPLAQRLIAKECDAQMAPIPFDERQVGSVILFWVHRARLPQHIAFLTSRDAMLHAWSDAGRVVEHDIDNYWMSRIYATYDLLET